MTTCESNIDQGLMRINGTTPNGNAVITREVEGQVPVLLRGGARVITTGGFVMDDTEAPLGVPLTYRVKMAGLTGADRIFQQNLMPTPTFTHGVQGWLAGTAAGRALSITTDVTAHSASVGLVTGSTVTTAPAVVPTLVGHVDSTVFVSGAYTLTPPTTGGTAIATNDWMVWFHQQLASIAAPATPAGWTLLDSSTDGSVRQLIWTRKRVGGDTGYTVSPATGGAGIGTLLWVRGATSDLVINTAVGHRGTNVTDILVSPVTTSLRPHLTVFAMSGELFTGAAAPGTGDVTGGATWQYTRSSGTNTRSLVISTASNADAGGTLPASVTYAGSLASGLSVGVAFQASSTLADRVIVRAKPGAVPAADDPYLLTGRFRYTTAQLNLWSDIAAFGTWQQVKTSKPTWLDVRGTSSTLPAGYLKVFLTIVNPATGADYIQPVQVMDALESRVNQWIDFAAFFQVPADIPATAEIRLLHGVRVSEYATNWYLDEFGITPGVHRRHGTLYWFDGDSAVPTNGVQEIWPGWTQDTPDMSISWTGTVGNSPSVLTGPTGMSATTTCQLDQADSSLLLPCEPVLISDPINVTLTTWVGLVHIDALTHPSKQAVHQIINRAAPIAISQVRGWETGSITVLTMNTDQRNQILSVIRSGRVLLLRNPDPNYPENNWFLALGDVTEDRPVPNQRITIREWTLPFVRVERPTGLIEASSGRTWQQIKDLGTWETIRSTNQDWLAVLAENSVS